MGISVTWPTVFFWWAQLKMAAWHLENTVGVVTLKEKQNKNTKKHKKKVVPKSAFCALSLSLRRWSSAMRTALSLSFSIVRRLDPFWLLFSILQQASAFGLDPDCSRFDISR